LLSSFLKLNDTIKIKIFAKKATIYTIFLFKSSLKMQKNIPIEETVKETLSNSSGDEIF